MAVTAGCASSDVEARRSYVGSEQIARPGRIIVYDFAATAEGVAPSSAISGRYGLGHRPQSSEELRLGRELGRRVADALVKDILAMGLPAERAHTGPPPNIGDLAITGGFVTINRYAPVYNCLGLRDLWGGPAVYISDPIPAWSRYG